MSARPTEGGVTGTGFADALRKFLQDGGALLNQSLKTSHQPIPQTRENHHADRIS